MPDESEALEGAVDPDRRTFVKRLLLGGVMAYPVVSSFTMSGVQAMFGSGTRSTTIAVTCNSSPPAPPSMYPITVACFCVNNAAVPHTFNAADGAVTLALTVPADAIHVGSQICIFRGNPATLGSSVPPGQVPVSAYAVKWAIPGGTTPPPAASALTLVVNDPAVVAGDQIYVIDSGAPVNVGTTSAGSWTVTFTQDPSYVVTQAAPAPPTTTTTTTTTAPTPAPAVVTAPTAPSPAAAVVTAPRFTG